MKTGVLIFFLLFACAAMSYSQTWQWTHVEPNNSAGSAYTNKLITDASGNLYELGSFSKDLYLAGFTVPPAWVVFLPNIVRRVSCFGTGY